MVDNNANFFIFSKFKLIPMLTSLNLVETNPRGDKTKNQRLKKNGIKSNALQLMFDQKYVLFSI